MAVTISGSTGIASVDGSAGSPGSRGTDANSGVFYSADAIKFSTGGTERAVIDNNGLSATGHVLQVVQAQKTDTLTSTSTSWADITGLTASITPSSTSNKILIMANVHANASSRYVGYRFLRDSTAVGLSTGATGNHTNLTFHPGTNQDESGYAFVQRNSSMTWLDSPSSTSSLDYALQVKQYYGSGTLYLNRIVTNAENLAYVSTTVSTFTLMEIGG